MAYAHYIYKYSWYWSYVNNNLQIKKEYDIVASMSEGGPECGDPLSDLSQFKNDAV